MNPKTRLLALTAALAIAGCNQPTESTARDSDGHHKPATTGTAAAAAPVKLEGEASRFSYAVGLNFGRSLEHFPVPLDKAALLAAIETAIEHKKPLLSPQEARETIRAVVNKAQQRAQAQRSALAEKNRKAGEAFLAANRKKEGVHTTPSGLQYQILREGDGPSPKATDTVRVHYKGTLLDGTVFDSSYARGKPATFPLNGVIKGWTEGLQLAKVGGRIRLFIPPELAYGAHGAGDRIGPNQTLIFDVELLGIE
ncbi:MAG: FKBP-type peptidyl-prolyl cis-trans isomerase [Zetaproteobacteria bacterium]|nr:MAG: FKBP-type peptidyl-prolyl cis-trans isomerase [Zetaproteobacteria bacterium]